MESRECMALFIFISDLYYVNLCVFEQIAADLAIHQLQFHTLGLGYKELVSLGAESDYG